MGKQISKLFISIQTAQLITDTQIKIVEALGCTGHTSGFCWDWINGMRLHGHGFLPL
jgi:hypothetical protein